MCMLYVFVILLDPFVVRLYKLYNSIEFDDAVKYIYEDLYKSLVSFVI
jgi:hypothetical protein